MSESIDERSVYEEQIEFHRRVQVNVELKLHLPHPKDKDSLPVAYHAVVQIGKPHRKWELHDIKNAVELANMFEMTDHHSRLGHESVRRELLTNFALSLGGWLEEALAKMDA